MAIVAAVLLASGRAAAEVVWRGDFECGDLSQWTKAQAVSPDRLEVFEGGSGQGGRYALKATVVQGDNPIGASGNRNELTYTSYEASGTERFYRWQTKFADDYPSADAWQLFTQWHHEGPSGSPPVEFVVRKEEIYLNIVGERVWGMPLERGRWIDFIFHVKWSPDPAEGFVELYVDGKKVLEKLPRGTQFPGELNYLKQGLYRDAKIQETGVVFHDGMTIGTSLADVMPEAAAAAGPGAAAPVGPAAPQAGAAAQAAAPGGAQAASPASPSAPHQAASGAIPSGDPNPGGAPYAGAGCSSASGEAPVLFLGLIVGLALLVRRRAAARSTAAGRRNRL
ncbi:MAG TPA: polysaccharide lyase [Myxococcales bacterium]